MGKQFTIQTTLERLDRKPALWKGLTIDELMWVTLCVVVTFCASGALVMAVLFGLGLLGGVLGLVMSLGGIPFVAGRIESAKKQHGPLMWLKLKRHIQQKGWFKFSGMMTDKVRWDIRLSEQKAIRYTGQKRD